MTGRAGFTKDANNRLKDNLKLGKIRGNSGLDFGENDPNYRSKADLTAIEDGLKFRANRRAKLKKFG